MRILISNDDGINAPGFAVLERIAQSLSDDVWVAAPEAEQSGAGHSLTLHRPLRVRHIDDRHMAIDGTPTDCVLLALNNLIPGKRPDLVLSGVNRGSNLADDVTYSGTIAAAMEATILGVPSISLSQHYEDGDRIRWQTVEAHACGLIRRLVAIGWPENVLLNLNFPDVEPDDVSGVEACCQGKYKNGDALIERLDPRGRPYYWIGEMRNTEQKTHGTDAEAVERGAISVTPLCLDLTDGATLAKLADALK
ncbi:MAG: 5'/3'-nucleotidase SurE [Alphaproteobacteria bacterium]|jgi:5'-nucleotidase